VDAPEHERQLWPSRPQLEEFVAALKSAVPVPIKTWDERLTSAQANRISSKVTCVAKSESKRWTRWPRPILLQSYLDSLQTEL